MNRATSAPPSGVTVRREAYGGEGPRWVVAQAEAELMTRYGGLDDGELGLTAAMFEPPAGAFLVARTRGAERPIGGVGQRTIAEGTGEVRRLWVDPAWRGRGVARALMDGIESTARALGLSRLQLATGDRQPEAMSLYTATGWERLHVDGNGRPLPVCHIRYAKVLR